MGSRYLTDLADVCRRTGYKVIEVDGWQQRARGSGGFDSGRPNHVMAHHTASAASMDGWGDVNYCTFNHQDAPLCNILLSRVPEIFVCAGGATNTNGSGHDPCGVTADDSMNSSAIGIEAGNNGVGEPWPTKQQDAYNILCAVLCDAYGFPIRRVHAHFEWAPSRKIDPAGSSRYASGSASWNMNVFRSDCGDTSTKPEPPPIIPEDDDIMLRAAKNKDTGNTYVLGNGDVAQTMDGLDSTETALRVAGGVIDVATKKVVYSWSNVGAIPGGDVKKYVGSY
jgi:hypothetical protein